MNILIKKKDKILKGRVNLTASKSESNRLLIIQALSNERIHIENLSSADDTQILKNLLSSKNQILDVGPAGTTMRFLTAYYATRQNEEKIITGSSRMKERTIKELVDSLIYLGAEITYLEKEGFPPVKIIGKELKGNEVSIDGSISSQFITALLLIAPVLPDGLKINIHGKVASKPYIEMTMKIIKYFGVDCKWEENTIIVPPSEYSEKNYRIEGDWSSASYWYEAASFSDDVELELKGLNKNSLQGDSVIADIMIEFGIRTEFLQDGILLTKSGKTCKYFNYNFSDCPDIAQTMAVVCSGLNIESKFEGLDSLRIKETDRIDSLIKELRKFGSDISEIKTNIIKINPVNNLSAGKIVETYKDHRMAMAFAPLSVIIPEIIIQNKDVVSKSYPEFWDDLEKSGFEISNLKD